MQGANSFSRADVKQGNNMGVGQRAERAGEEGVLRRDSKLSIASYRAIQSIVWFFVWGSFRRISDPAGLGGNLHNLVLNH